MTLTYAIGDVHGCASLLDRLLEAIAEHRGRREARLVFLGDYVDRGPDSAGVVARLRALQDADPGRVVCLMGNHEDMLVRARSDRESFWHWIENGGRATLASFGVDHVDALPDADVAWMAGLPTLHRDEQRYFVHAGLRPGRPVETEDRRTHLWIREPFLAGEHDFGRHVVHGHTPRRCGIPEALTYRTNLDTGAVFGGALTAGIFSDDQRLPIGYIQVGADGRARELAGLGDR